jgi:hypothetical protein
MIAMTTITASRDVTVGSDLRSVTTMDAAGVLCVISVQRSTHGITVISSVSGSSVAIAFADLRRSGDGSGTTKCGVGSA